MLRTNAPRRGARRLDECLVRSSSLPEAPFFTSSPSAPALRRQMERRSTFASSEYMVPEKLRLMSKINELLNYATYKQKENRRRNDVDRFKNSQVKKCFRYINFMKNCDEKFSYCMVKKFFISLMI